MIFLTVGSALPFDRLVTMIDELVGEGVLLEEIFAQIGDGEYKPKHFSYERFLSESQFQETVADASAIVSHAGIGTITSSLRHRKPLLVLPRTAEFGELVDDHQEKTAKAYSSLGHLLVFRNPQELRSCLQELPTFQPQPRTPNVDGVSLEIGRLLEYQFSSCSAPTNDTDRIT